MGSILQLGDLGTRLQQALKIKGRAPAPLLGDLVHPVVIVADARDDPRSSVERPAVGAIEFTPAAGQFALAYLGNPAGSQADLFVDYAIIHASAAGRVDLRITNADPAGAAPAPVTQFRSTDFLGSPNGFLQAASEVAATPGAVMIGFPASISSFLVPLDWKVGPGFFLLVRAQTANVTIRFSPFWREIMRDNVRP